MAVVLETAASGGTAFVALDTGAAGAATLDAVPLDTLSAGRASGTDCSVVRIAVDIFSNSPIGILRDSAREIRVFSGVFQVSVLKSSQMPNGFLSSVVLFHINEIQFPIGPRKAKAEKLLALSLREESLADGRCCCCCCCHRCNAYYYLISFDFPSSFSDSVYPKVVRFGKALLFTDFYRTKTTTHTTKCKCNT